MDARSAPHAFVVSLEAQLDEKTQESHGLRRTLAQFRSTTEQLTKRYEKLQSDYRMERQRSETLLSKLAASTKANDDLNVRLDELMTERDAAIRLAREAEEKAAAAAEEKGEDEDEDVVDGRLFGGGIVGTPSNGVGRRRVSASILSELQMLRQAIDKYQRKHDEQEERLEGLQQECNVSKKERQDALEEQEALTAQCYRLRQDFDVATQSRDELTAQHNALEEETARIRFNLDRANRESREAQEKRNWAFEARSQVIRECNEARVACDELRQARDQAVSNHMQTLQELDGLKADLGMAKQEAKEVANERRTVQRRINTLVRRLDEWIGQDVPSDDAFEDDVEPDPLNGGDSGVGIVEPKEDAVSRDAVSRDAGVGSIKVKICSVDLTEHSESDSLSEKGAQKRLEKVFLTCPPSEWGIHWETRLFAADIQPGNGADQAAGLLEADSWVTEINGRCTTNCSLDEIHAAVGSSLQGGMLTVRKTPLKVPVDIRELMKECKSPLKLSGSCASLASIGSAFRSRTPVSFLGDLRNTDRKSPSRKTSVGSNSLTVDWAVSRSSSFHGRNKEKEREIHPIASVLASLRQGRSMSPESNDSDQSSRKRPSISTELRNEIRKSLFEARMLSADKLLLSPGSADSEVVTPRSKVCAADSRYLSWSVPPQTPPATTETASGKARKQSVSNSSDELPSEQIDLSLSPAFVVSNSNQATPTAKSPLASPFKSPAEPLTYPKADSRRDGEERTLTLQKRNGTLGFLIKGGNATGIFVSEIRPGFPASGLDGVQPGDEILMVGGHYLAGMTREEAAGILRGVVDSVPVVVCHDMRKFLQLPSSCDSFYVKCLRCNDGSRGSGEISLSKGDILRVTDTVVNHPASSWHAVVMGNSSRSGAVPNMKRSLLGGEALYELINQPAFL
eukprot:m.25217 g.25217  ORF g.25217 m.25217 type:complete len:910 (+) comp28764_c0_seq2:122-2851(+)